jgi:hypothetical protein
MIMEKDNAEVSPADSSVRFRVSSFCNGGGCVEVALLPCGGVAVRDGKDTGRPALNYTEREWRDFIAGVKNGEFDFG